MKKLICIFAFLLSANVMVSQNINTNPFWKGDITLSNGTVKSGLVKVPNNPKQKRVVYKISEKGKVEKIKRDAIASVVVYSENGNAYLYENTKCILHMKREKPSTSSLLLVSAKNDYVTFYVESGAYKVDKSDGELGLLYRYNYGQDFPTVAYYIKKRDKSVANLFYMTGHLGGIKKGTKLHLTEAPNLVDRVLKKEFKKKDVAEIISLYINATNDL
ncbi:hypothetical protein [Psychroserpens sp. MEBiC05023]